MKRSRLATLAAIGLLLAVSAPPALARPGDESPAKQRATTTKVQILALNDFHGNLEPPSGSGGGSPRVPSSRVDDRSRPRGGGPAAPASATTGAGRVSLATGPWPGRTGSG